MVMLSNYDSTKRMHATLTLPRKSLTIEQVTGKAPLEEMSLTEFLSEIGIHFTGRPFTRANVTGTLVKDEVVDVYLSWEEEEDVGECYSG